MPAKIQCMDTFIIELEERNVIWDQRSTHYKNKYRKEKAYIELAEICIPNYQNMNKSDQKEAGMNFII